MSCVCHTILRVLLQRECARDRWVGASGIATVITKHRGATEAEMAAAHAGDASSDASDPSIHDSSLADQRTAGSFAQGMYVSLWPKIERCHNYVAVLLAAQEQLQETVDQLVAGLKEAEEAEGSSLVGYADRLKNFPTRVEKLQRKLELIEDRLLALKEARNRGASCISKYNPEDPAHHMTSPLF